MEDVTSTVPDRVIEDLEALRAEAEALEPALRSLCRRAELAERRHDETNARGADVHPSAMALLASLGRLARHPVAVTGSRPDDAGRPMAAAVVRLAPARVDQPAAPVTVEDLADRLERLEGLLAAASAFTAAALD